ncbi:MAG: hypothetical protein M1831_006364 [Alyxoria varia]|nr:MAG: hypothetical protein M1831_006364 [Alyxoria varia]
MPLNILPKKSWNPYSPAAIARVRADEAAAEERQKTEDLRQIERDAQRRLALLRGESPPPPEEDEKAEGAGSTGFSRGASRVGGREGDEKRKWRKLAGEDDTDRDMRLALEAAAPRDGHDSRHEKGKESKSSKGKKERDAPITDREGHIQLFTAPQHERGPSKTENSHEAKAEHHNRERDEEGAMRFSDAAGYRKHVKDSPWYTDEHRAQKAGREVGRGVDILSGSRTRSDVSENRKIEQSEERRQQRAEARMNAADPITAMISAQTQLKRVKNDKTSRRREREKELEDLMKEQDRQIRKRRRREKHGEEQDGLEDFSLDVPPEQGDVYEQHSPQMKKGRNHEHRHHKHRHRHRHHRDETHEPGQYEKERKPV